MKGMRTKRALAPLSVTAITNFVLAAEAFLAAGFLLGRVRSLSTAAGYWALALLFMGISALSSGIDHGSLEPNGNTPVRRVFEKATSVAAGILAFFVLLAAHLVATFLLDSFLVVILGCAPAMILFLVMSLLGIAHPGPRGRHVLPSGQKRPVPRRAHAGDGPARAGRAALEGRLRGSRAEPVARGDQVTVRRLFLM